MNFLKSLIFLFAFSLSNFSVYADALTNAGSADYGISNTTEAIVVGVNENYHGAELILHDGKRIMWRGNRDDAQFFIGIVIDLKSEEALKDNPGYSLFVYESEIIPGQLQGIFSSEKDHWKPTDTMLKNSVVIQRITYTKLNGFNLFGHTIDLSNGNRYGYSTTSIYAPKPNWAQVGDEWVFATERLAVNIKNGDVLKILDERFGFYNQVKKERSIPITW